MRHFFFIVSALALASVPVLSADAQNGKASIPDLRGVWSAPGTACQHPKGRTEDIVVQFNISEQEGRFLRGTKSWAHEGEAVMDAGGKLVTKATETIVGVIRDDGVTIHFAEHDDLGLHFTRLVDENTMEDVYVEPGAAAAVCHHTLVRKPS